MKVKEITISKEVSRLEEPVQIGLLLIWDKDYAGFVDWEVIYTVDCIAARMPLTLYKSSCEESYKAGMPTWKHFLLNAVDTISISRIAHLNIASLTVTANC